MHYQQIASLTAHNTSNLLNAGWFRAILTLCIILILQIIARRLINAIVKRAVHHTRGQSEADRLKRQNTLTAIFRTATSATLWVIGIMLIFSEFNINVAALATGAGLVSILIGFGAQSTIKDYLAGMFIILENQYRVGDIVQMSGGSLGTPGVSGSVEEITIRITRLRDLNGNLHVVRNGEPSVISNLSITFANVNVDLEVSYDTDIDRAEAIINKVGEEQAQHEKWAKDIIEPVQLLRLDQFGNSSIVLKCLGKVKPGRQWDIAGDFRRRIKKTFDEQGIEIPFPQVVIHQADAKK